MRGKWKEICLKSLQKKLFLRFAHFKRNMKLLYTIKIFEFTLTKNGHFGLVYGQNGPNPKRPRPKRPKSVTKTAQLFYYIIMIDKTAQVFSF